MTTPTNHPDAIIHNQRTFPFPPRAVFNAHADPTLLAQWWGPAGFTNTFHQFDFQPQGKWLYTMHGPNGHDYPNEAIFQDIQPNARISFEHTVGHWFILTITLSPTADGQHTHLTWAQQHASPEIAEKMRPLCEPANEQNLDRLQALLTNRNHL